jgi:hypothetical protein
MILPLSVLVFAFTLVLPISSHSQPRPTRAAPPSSSFNPLPADSSDARRATITILGGIASPLSKAGLTEFWGTGPSGAAQVLVHVSRSVSVGMGLDVASYIFSSGDFSSKFPTIRVQEKNILGISILLTAKFVPVPQARLTPFFVGQLGAAQVTPTEYREVVDSVRVTYYNIPRRFRLASNVAAGFDLYIARGFWIEMEGKLAYVHNDPSRGTTFFLRGGIVVRL